MSEYQDTASIILCAGKGRRMNAPRTPKVCFPIAGEPAVCHMLGRLNGLGVGPNILVVGHLAGAVVEEVGPRFPDALYAYQGELAGTGHATRAGAGILRAMKFDGGVLVVAGDKVIEPRALRKMLDTFDREQPDVALLVAPKERWPNAGRIVGNGSNEVLGIIERADLHAAEESGRQFEFGGRRLTARDVESECAWVNQAVYVFRAEALFDALDHLAPDNVQGEEYLTDAIAHIVAAGGRVAPAPVDDPEDVLGFNNPAELLAIEEHFRRQAGVTIEAEPALDPSLFKPAVEWERRLAEPDAEMDALLHGIYGKDSGFCAEKRLRLLDTVRLFIERYGTDGAVTVVRAPGRVNLMGRHVDHRGGCVNLMAINREHILVARPREDTVVRARNADAGRFDDLEFSVNELLDELGLDDWREFVDSETVVKMVRDLQGNWGNYLKAPMLRLQQQFKDRKIRGVDCVVSGDIPMAAGLSSSSALVVAMAEALVLTNRLDVAPHDLVDLCGEGEWFVGTRGGAADHAAVKLSQYGQVAKVGFFPFTVHEYAPFPEGYTLVVCNSRIQARKAAGARNAFNERVASYELAVHLVRKRFPNYAPLIQHLRDIAPGHLGVKAADVYRLLLQVPERITPGELKAEIGADVFDRIAAMHSPPDEYPLRKRLLFGISECERSAQCMNLLHEGAMEELGVLMNVSHDGDRVAARNGQPFAVRTDDDYLHTCIAALKSEEPGRVAQGQLAFQPGSYACSIPQIDHMVDLALDLPGVLGAQICGAGLGGCMMVLAANEAAPAVVRRMNNMYYEPSNMQPGALPITPIAGCCPLVLA